MAKAGDSAEGKGGSEMFPLCSCEQEIQETGGDGQRGHGCLTSFNLYQKCVPVQHSYDFILGCILSLLLKSCCLLLFWKNSFFPNGLMCNLPGLLPSVLQVSESDLPAAFL